MGNISNVRRIVLRINPDCEEHANLETQIKNMRKTMGFTNTQAVLMLLKGYSAAEYSDKETLIRNDTNNIEQTDNLFDTFSDL